MVAAGLGKGRNRKVFEEGEGAEEAEQGRKRWRKRRS